MSNYSDEPSNCRVDFFKESGKWYSTETIQFAEEHYPKEVCIYKAFRCALHAALEDRYNDMQAVCLDPYHELSHPLSVIKQATTGADL
jgi:hypothetical protein